MKNTFIFRFSKFFAILCGMIFFQCCILEPKGPARWDTSLSSTESKEKGVFVSEYKALPFYYKDSLIEIRLIFSEIFTECMHWYDTTQNKYLSSRNSETIEGQILIAQYQKDSSIIAIYKEEDLYWQPVFSGGQVLYEEGFILYPSTMAPPFGDTITIPIEASVFYQRAANLPDYPRIRFGDLILVKNDQLEQ